MKKQSAKPTVAVLATLDTKGNEVAFLKERLLEAGVKVLLVDGGILGSGTIPADIPAGTLARKAGSSLNNLRRLGHEGKAMGIMIQGAVKAVQELYRQGAVQGLIGLGGSMGTTLGTGVMRSLPFGFPKLMVSTMASRDTRPFVGSKDILMYHSVVDLVGLNRMSRQVLSRAAGAIAGMVRLAATDGKAAVAPLVAVSTLGTTEACIRHFRAELERAGWELAVFHTVGAGGQALEDLVAEGIPQAVIEVSLHELVDHLFKGSYDAGPHRLEGALSRGLPTVLVPGNVDFIVTGPPETLPSRYKNRPIHVHNAAICVVRTSAPEMKRLAGVVADKLRSAAGPVALLLPAKGFSVFDSPGKPFFDLAIDRVFIEAVKKMVPKGVLVKEVPAHVNDPLFAEEVLKAFLEITAGLGR
ncbi:MAG: Tm-1-like ATP-binding domain-containing protein [Desulfobacterota bacterium]|nr:Tm-1-like ATP-binding domain-containing protein [Thermodesulfobacteriota bacterium]